MSWGWNLLTVYAIEWVFLARWILPVLLALFILLMVYWRRRLDNVVCAKYDVFHNINEPGPEDLSEPKTPAYCQLQPARHQGLWGKWSINTAWVWIAIGLNLLWIAIVLGAFLLAHFAIPSHH